MMPTAIIKDLILLARFLLTFSPTFSHLISFTLGTFNVYSGN
jgi:hypothetical protein